MFNVVKYTQSLVQFNTINPPGHEEDCIMFAANTLQQAGFHIAKQPFGEKRMNVVASLPGLDEKLDPLVLTGHLDTVPLGESDWTYSPFDGDIIGDKLYGRGSTDMKGGVAAMIGAALQLNINSKGKPKRGITLVLTSGEETGCTGARELIDNGLALLGNASAMVVGEPTANKISTAHKGVLFIKAIAKGVTAHSSQPELGDNAIYKVAKAISKIEKYEFSGQPHPQLGQPSINVGMISGGMNVNSVPDHAQFSIDIRTNSTRKHQDFVTDLSAFLGDNIELKTFADMAAIST
ncbi:MAG: M20 family metallopeptidase, partial [Paraglaciecola sp.]|nr:M20 family metallopeptidase [Paraglaciecola sp.]